MSLKLPFFTFNILQLASPMRMRLFLQGLYHFLFVWPPMHQGFRTKQNPELLACNLVGDESGGLSGGCGSKAIEIY